MNRKFIILSVVLCLLLLVGIFIARDISINNNASNRIEEAIQKYSETLGHSVFTGNIIEKVDVGKNAALVFFLNETNSVVYYSILEKQSNGKWQVENLSWIPTSKEAGETNPYSYAGIRSDNINGYWGVIFDPDVETIVLQSEQEDYATVIHLANRQPIWYKVYEKTAEEFEDVEIVKAIDSNGEEVPWNPHEIKNNTPQAALDKIHKQDGYAKVLDIYDEIPIDEDKIIVVYKGLLNDKEDIFIANVEKDSRKWRVTDAQNIGFPSAENLSSSISTDSFAASYVEPPFEVVSETERVVEFNDEFSIWIKVY